MADVKITVDYSELTGLVKTSGQTKQALSLMAKEFAKTGDVTRFKNSVNALAKAQTNLTASSRKTYFELIKLGNQMKQDALFANELGAAYERSAVASQVFGKRANRTGVLAQQAGYQFGDFAVQVQSGTNVMVAFGQQATQLVGTLSMLATSTKAILAFSALGVIVPVITAIGAAFMRAGEDSQEAVKSMSEGIDSLKSKIDEAEESVGSFVDIVSSLNEKDIKDSWENLGVLTGEKFQAGFFSTLSNNFLAQLRGDLENYSNTAGRLAGERFAAAFGDESGIITYEYLEQIQEAVESLDTQSIQDAITNLSAFESKATDQGRQFLRNLIEILDLSKGYTEEVKKAAFELDKALRAGESLADLDLSLGVDAAAAAAALLAERMNLSLAAAERMVGLATGQGVSGPDAALSQVRGALTSSGIRREDIVFQQTYNRGRRGSSGASGGSGGSSRTEIDYLKRLEEEAEFKRNLIGLSEQETFSLERRRQITELLTRNNRTLTDTDQERISAIIATEEQTRALIAEEERRTQAIDLVKNNMENAFMEMVQGSKSVEDAFRAMLFNIISELYRQAVVKTFVNAFTGFLGFKDGGAFSNGTQVKAFANGGVVDGPTTFPMSGGRTGLMGEAGPEAIMPLKRGSDGKLGVHVKGGNTQEAPIVINQSFNFQAGGDESVKKLIAQSAPKIADMAKNSVLEARRRGGKMRSTFG